MQASSSVAAFPHSPHPSSSDTFQYLVPVHLATLLVRKQKVDELLVSKPQAQNVPAAISPRVVDGLCCVMMVMVKACVVIAEEAPT